MCLVLCPTPHLPPPAFPSAPAFLPALQAELRAVVGDQFSSAPAVLESHGRDESYHAPVPPQARTARLSSAQMGRSTGQAQAGLRLGLGLGAAELGLGWGGLSWGWSGCSTRWSSGGGGSR